MKLSFKRMIPQFSRSDILIWIFSVSAVFLSYLISPQNNPYSMIGSIIGVTALIFVAKGAVFGQFLMVLFCLFYGCQAAVFRYYGEMITYFGMSLPAVIFNIVSWLRHPYLESAQVKVGSVTKKKLLFVAILTVSVTVLFYFILSYLNTAQLFISILSVSTSVLASSLSFLRSPWFAMAYALNDVVLLFLWGITVFSDFSVLPVFTCFAVFFINDLNGFFSWQKMKREQENKKMMNCQTKCNI